MWCTGDENVEFVMLTRSNEEIDPDHPHAIEGYLLPKIYALPRSDFSCYERRKCQMPPLPRGWGCMNFGHPVQVVPDSGGFCVVLGGATHTLLFHPPLTGSTVAGNRGA